MTAHSLISISCLKYINKITFSNFFFGKNNENKFYVYYIFNIYIHMKIQNILKKCSKLIKSSRHIIFEIYNNLNYGIYVLV